MDLYEIMEDFDITLPRILISGRKAIIDNVKQILIMSEEMLTVDFGKSQISVYGTDIILDSIYDGRIQLSGTFTQIEFFGKGIVDE